MNSPFSIDASEDSLVHLIELGGTALRQCYTEGQNGQLGFSQYLHSVHGAKPAQSPLSQVELFVQASAKGCRTEEIHRQPHSQASEVARQLGREVGKIRRAGVLAQFDDGLQIIGMHEVSLAKVVEATNQQATCSEWQK